MTVCDPPWLSLERLVAAWRNGLNERSQQLMVRMEQDPRLVYDYRLQDTFLRERSLPITAYDKNVGCPVGSATLILVTRETGRRMGALCVEDSTSRIIPLSEVLPMPSVIAGYSATRGKDARLRTRMAHWFLVLLRELLGQGFGLYVEVTGRQKSKGKSFAENRELLGSVDPRSAAVLSLVRGMRMSRIPNCYEPNTLGPVYFRVSDRG